jgi:tRNA(Ile)-lysidine synthetase-like protein
MYDHTRMSEPVLQNVSDLVSAITAVPTGRWGVGVSGGADSVALLLLLHGCRPGDLHVIHLDHETREGESTLDSRFVGDLAHTIERRSVIEAGKTDLPANLSARFRAARFELFRQVVAAKSLNGVLLAHHAGDQAETVLQRLLRGGGPTAIGGMLPLSIVDGLTVSRPLLDIAPERLRDFLRGRNQPWREDASNKSDEYLRNRLRGWLADRSDLRDALVRTGDQSRMLRGWLDEQSPVLAASFGVSELANLGAPHARHAASRWLAGHGSDPRDVNREVCDRLIAMAVDAASPPRQHFPGGLLVRRRQGVISRS